MLLGGCTVHKPDVQQGNIIEPEVLAQLHPGLSKKQVKFLMGTPIIQDPFHPWRWDYIYWFKAQGKPAVRQQVTVYFDKGVVRHLTMAGISPATPQEQKGPQTPPAAP